MRLRTAKNNAKLILIRDLSILLHFLELFKLKLEIRNRNATYTTIAEDYKPTFSGSWIDSCIARWIVWAAKNQCGAHSSMGGKITPLQSSLWSTEEYNTYKNNLSLQIVRQSPKRSTKSPKS